MTKTLINTYASRSSAVRAAKRLELVDPIYEDAEGGRIALYSVVKAASEKAKANETAERPAKADGPVARFRKIFSENYGEKSWSEIIKLAVADGIGENTAKTYYYKLKKEHEAAEAAVDAVNTEVAEAEETAQVEPVETDAEAEADAEAESDEAEAA